MVRETRNRKPTNYALDPYGDLGGDDSDPPPVQPDSEDDEDFKIGPRLAAEFSMPATAAAGSGPGDGRGEDEDDDGEDDLSGLDDDDGPQRRRRRRPTKLPLSPQSPPPPPLSRGATLEATPGEGARLHRPHKFRVNRVPGTPAGTRRRDRLTSTADDAAAAADHTPELELLPVGMRPPDPSVKITYRPGFIKSTGKRERIVTAYGANTQTLVKAVKVRDTFIGLPAVPERSCLGFTPFWKRGQDHHVDVGMGQQQTQRIEYYNTPGTTTDGANVEKYLPPETGVIKCIIGPQTGKKIITFQRFGMHDLAGGGGGKRGFILNAGRQVVGVDWAPNRHKGSVTSNYYEKGPYSNIQIQVGNISPSPQSLTAPPPPPTPTPTTAKHPQTCARPSTATLPRLVSRSGASHAAPPAHPPARPPSLSLSATNGVPPAASGGVRSRKSPQTTKTSGF